MELSGKQIELLKRVKVSWEESLENKNYSYNGNGYFLLSHAKCPLCEEYRKVSNITHFVASCAGCPFGEREGIVACEKWVKDLLNFKDVTLGVDYIEIYVEDDRKALIAIRKIVNKLGKIIETGRL